MSIQINGEVTSDDYTNQGITKNKLTRVVLGRSVTSIGSSAFYNCTNLKEVVIGNNVKTIGSQAFASCTHLDDIVIGNSVQTIKDKAFLYCGTYSSSLTITIESSIIDSIEPDSFLFCNNVGRLNVIESWWLNLDLNLKNYIQNIMNNGSGIDIQYII